MFAVHHLALTAKSLDDSGLFYDELLRVFGYRRHYSSDSVLTWVPASGSETMPEFIIYAARPDQVVNEHKLYDPGVHHYCFRVGSRHLVDEVFKVAKENRGGILEPPTEYSKYA